MADDRKGMVAATGAANAGALTEAPEGEQLDLLAEAEIVARGQRQYATEAEKAAALDVIERGIKRGRGRPAGARNRSTKELAAFILQQHGSPVLNAARAINMSLPEFAAKLGCSLVEAYDRWLKTAEFVTRFVHQELPKAVEIDAKGIPGLTIVLGGDGANASGEIEQDQGVVVLDGEVVGRGDLDADHESQSGKGDQEKPRSIEQQTIVDGPARVDAARQPIDAGRDDPKKRGGK